MANVAYTRGRTALLLVDPYNDSLSEGGKLWPMLKGVAKEVELLDNLRTITAAIRKVSIPIFIVPHRRWEPGDYVGWDHPSPYQVASGDSQVFAKGTWGGEWHPNYAPRPGDIIVKEHWGSSDFANTDLDFLLKQKQVSHLILIGLITNSCIASTARFAVEFG